MNPAQPPPPAHQADIRLLFLTRSLRMFAYGLLSVILVLYLAELGLGEARIGLLLTLTLVGDTAISLWLTTRADRLGRRRMLVAGAALMAFAGVVFALTRQPWLLLIAGVIGVISPSGKEVGPFLAIEQAALAHVISGQRRTAVFAWYALAGSLSAALGALAGGAIFQLLYHGGISALTSYRALVFAYAAAGVLLAALFIRLTAAVEAEQPDATKGLVKSILGLHESRRVVFRLSALFALDAFAGGFVMDSFLAYWFSRRFGINVAVIGGILFGANLLAGFSALLAARIAGRFGLINTMVFTHLPSNFLLILVPLMPNLPLAIAVLLLRFSISQMDVPTRQSYTMAVVTPRERAAAAGLTGVARTVGAAIAPALAGLLLARQNLASSLFFFAGGLKIVYDLLLYRGFLSQRPPEELVIPTEKPA
jgi:MFS family permease